MPLSRQKAPNIEPDLVAFAALFGPSLRLTPAEEPLAKPDDVNDTRQHAFSLLVEAYDSCTLALTVR